MFFRSVWLAAMTQVPSLAERWGPGQIGLWSIIVLLILRKKGVQLLRDVGVRNLGAMG